MNFSSGLLKSSILLVCFIGLYQPAKADAQQDINASTVSPGTQQAENNEAQNRLMVAYQKEYAFLEAQLRNLRQHSTDFSNTSKRTETQKQAAIDRIEGDWINLQTESERMQRWLTEASRELDSLDDARNVLESTFLQAETTLEPYQLDVINKEPYLSADSGDRINTLFGETLALLEQLATVRLNPGVFFLGDGTEVQGQVIRIGNIAAYGISKNGSGVLAPAGEGRMKIWSKPSVETAESLAAGKIPNNYGIFLFESVSQAIEERAGKTVLSVIKSGGTIAWIIVALGLLAAVLIILRFFFLRNAGAATDKIVSTVGGLVRKGHIDEALMACKKFKGSTARIVAAAVRNLDRDRSHLEDIISESILHESSTLNRFGAMILVIAAVSPLLGLLGTVTGMITTFDIITEFGTGDPKLLSGGISIALVTTEIGLAVAIPALLMGNVLSGWSESIKDDMEKGALGVINQYKEHHRKV